MSVAVLVPFTSNEPWRVRARNHVVAWYATAGYEVIEGTCPEPWRKAVAVAGAARRTDADILVVADADCLCDGVDQAATAVFSGATWAVPHNLVHRLDETATEAVYDGTDPEATTGRLQRPYVGFAGGGIVAIARTVYDRVPLDPRFEGWGGEDSSWALALTCLAGEPARFAAPLFHLFHPPAPRMSRRWGTAAGRALEIRYRLARNNRRQMADLLAEAAHTPIGAA
jgi:hypothetical protein